jgi:hypothetical protein
MTMRCLMSSGADSITLRTIARCVPLAIITFKALRNWPKGHLGSTCRRENGRGGNVGDAHILMPAAVEALCMIANAESARLSIPGQAR